MPSRRISTNTNTNTISRFEEGVETEVVSIGTLQRSDDASEADTCNRISNYCFVFISYLFIVFMFPFVICFCFKVVLQYQRVVIFRLGKVSGCKGPGLIFINPFITKLRLVDLRTTSYEIRDKTIMTLSAITVTVTAVVFYRILDSRKVVNSIKDIHDSVKLLAESSTEAVLRTKHVGDILEHGDQICEVIHHYIREQSADWGVFIERFEIKKLEVPDELQRALTAETMASCEMYAKLIQLDAEKKVYEFVNEAVNRLDKSPQAYHLLNLITLKDLMSSNMKPSLNFSLSPPNYQSWMQAQRSGTL